MDLHRIKEILKADHTLLAHEWKGAVLFLCNQEHVFLIKRSESMPTHGGQVAFVGGHRLPHESHPWEVAQREYEEETHHSRNTIAFLGCLPPVMTARLQPITPVMAQLLIPTSQFLREVKSNGEWDEILAYPWEELMKEGNWEHAWRHGTGRSPVMFHTIQAGTFLTESKTSSPHLLWGATASMIWSFLHLYFKPDVSSY